MNTILLIWLAMGLCTAVYDIRDDLKQGKDFKVKHLGGFIILTCFGPIGFWVMIMHFFKENDFVLISAKRKEKSTLPPVETSTPMPEVKQPKASDVLKSNLLED